MMKSAQKAVIVLAILLMAATVYAEVPDISKWFCPKGIAGGNPDYGIEVTVCDIGGYVKISGELIYIHEHRMGADKTVYYNALKTNKGNWVEIVNQIDMLAGEKEIESNIVILSIIDDDNTIIAERYISKLR